MDTWRESPKGPMRGQNHSPMSQKINKQNAPAIVLYTREGCHLCDDAEFLLMQHGLAPQIVDIEGSDELKSRFGMSVPVVEIDGRVRFRGRVHPVLLRRIVEHYRR
jgi:glutaredoxin